MPKSDKETKSEIKKRKDQDWYDLYKYIEKEIMNYGEDLKLNKNMVLRLKGLHEGKFIANRKVQKLASYSVECISMCLKLNKSKIINSIHGKNFDSENHKFNYIMAIVESDINDTALILKKKESAVNKAKNINLDSVEHSGLDYKNKIKESNETERQKKLLDELC